MSGPRFLDAGECALTVEFGSVIDEALATRVLALDAALAAHPLPGIAEVVPTYRSLMVHYDPLILSRAALIVHLQSVLVLSATKGPAGTISGALWCLPACYDPALAEDLPHIAAATGLSPESVIKAHSSSTFTVVMYGFAPGWAYLSGLPTRLALPRRTSPRDRIPAGSLIIAGGQAIVAALAMPSGWHILGRTPERLFAPTRDPAFLLSPGDRLRFDPVDTATFVALERRAAMGETLARQVPE